MSKVTIEGIEVDFPFEPYEEQVKYMTKVIECLENRKFGVLESPTGTGKTLSLLCSTLSWLRTQKSLPLPTPADLPTDGNKDEAGLFTNVIPKYLFPRIIYSSRTHSQLSKAMLELQKTAFKTFKVTILGSRDQMCIHPQVKTETNLSLKNALCSMHMKNKTCHFGNNVERVKDDMTFTEGITDIEDLISKSTKKACCPYYMARELQEKADVIFMPYNYLFDYHIRKALKISLVNSVIILDEAHNIDKVCEEACSVSIKSSDIALAISDVTKEMQVMYNDNENGFLDMERDYTSDELCFVKEKLASLESVINDLKVSKDVTITQNGSYIFELLQKAGIDVNTSQELIRVCSQIYEFVSNISDSNSRRGGALKKLADDLSVINSTVEGTNFNMPEKDFRVFIEEEIVRNSFGGFNTIDSKGGKVVNYWCFNPGFSLNNVMIDSIRSLILTSGTLAPISSFVKEMSLTSPVTAECTHIVSRDQVFVCQAEVGPRNIQLKCNYANRQNVDYWQELGLTLQNFFRIIPDGVLLFFPGYATLNIAVKMWRESGLWEKLGLLKPIFIEPKLKSELQQVSQEYYKAIETGRGKGAVFIGVCRGKISEGLDFSDQYGRAVIIAGLPYPPLHDPKVKLKKQYIDQNRKNNTDLTGDVWYVLEATRAVNQAIGRVIRHAEDYGAIILCDAQFNNQKIVQNLSKWVQQRIIKPRSFGESVGVLRGFFKKNENSAAARFSLTQNKMVCTPSFDHSSSSGLRRSGTNHSDILFSQPSAIGGSSSQSVNNSSRSSVLLSKIKLKNSLESRLKVVSNLLNHYENLSQFNAAKQSKSCLENLDKDELYSNTLESTSSLQFFNDMLRNENLLIVLDRVIEDFEKKCFSYAEKYKLDSTPSYIFDVPEPSADFAPKTYQNFELDRIKSKEVESLIKRLHSLSIKMERAVGKCSSDYEPSPNNQLLGDISLAEEGLNAPAKRRKIKLEFIKIDDIHLPGSDQLSREKEKRLNDTKNFLIELKSTLEPSSYTQLMGLIKKFSSEEDFNETVNYLRILFPDTDDEFKSIFNRCYLLFTGKWEREFKKYCLENNK
ncbi:regulator of telomere elongation helicase 1 homolog [Halyomorpha halys]|uniref:regulator of telomere elongation helicase 1 homolog n=1 Tax=Halyomorpha halys TaxID=286706 RepID=UPI0006D4ED51|nr:regulator of telomere elongation helicase 1 homolog [Halyomorpha halys]